MAIKHIYKLIGSLKKIPHHDDDDAKTDIEEIFCFFFYQNFIHFTFNNISGNSYHRCNSIQILFKTNRNERINSIADFYFLTFVAASDSAEIASRIICEIQIRKFVRWATSTFWIHDQNTDHSRRWSREQRRLYLSVAPAFLRRATEHAAHHFPFYDGQFKLIFSEIPSSGS